MQLIERMEYDEFATFYSLHIKLVEREAYYILRDERDALEVADLTMWYVYCHADKFRGMSNACIRAYLASVARARSFDLIRRRNRKRCVGANEAIDTLYESGEYDVEKLLEIQEFRDTVEGCVRMMSDVYRDTLILRIAKGMTLREISERLEIPLETAKSRWRRGLKLIEKSVRLYGFSEISDF